MSIRRYVSLFILLAVAALAAPAGAAAAPGSFIAADTEEFGPLFYDSSGTNFQDNVVNILPGERVDFSYPVGNSVHNVAFLEAGPQPTSCTQTAGTIIPNLPVPPLPNFTQAPGWAGFCTFNNPGTYSFLCQAHGYMTGTVVVAPAPNQAPTVTADRTPAGDVVTGTTLAFTATGTDPDGDTLTYAWDFGDGDTSTDQNPTHGYATPGTKDVKVTVDDGKGGTAEATLTVNVTPPAGGNTPPTVTSSRAPDGNTRVGITVAFSATGTDADDDPLTYSWDFGDGSPASNLQNPEHTYLTAGTYNAIVTVSDGRGGSASAAPLTVVVQANRAPFIFTASANPSAGLAPVAAEFSANAFDFDGNALTYEWDLDGDGTFETSGQTASHTYTESASPVLRVSDGFGGVSTRTLEINVLPEVLDPDARFHALIFSRTAAFRHSSIDEGITAIRKLGTEQNFTVDAIEDPALFTDAFLSRYDVVIFLSTTGDVLDDEQQAAFERFIQSGHGYVGIHSATDTEYGWPWYGQLTGAYFRNHPEGTPTATVVNEDPTSPATAHLPARWTRVDEWYNFQTNVNPVVNGGGTDISPRGLTPIHVLLTVDESTYDEDDGTEGVDDDHPIAWCKRFDGGRMFYTALGHTEASYVDADFLKHIQGGLEVAAGVTPDANCGIPPNIAPAIEASRVPAGVVDAGEQVAFTAGASDADGEALTYAWDFGDGATSTEENPTHVFGAMGAYTVTLTVTDARGLGTTVELPVTVASNSTETQGDVGADVPLVLALAIAGPADFGSFTPGVANDYETSVTAQITSTAGSASLTVVDPSDADAGRLVNGTYALEQSLQARATNAANPDTAFGPIAGAASPLTLLQYPRAISADAVTIGFKQPIGAGETLRAGSYAKSLTFTLSTTTP
ncbi:MAG TPA: ThuA domain-containing protein [Solirubrobacter sp.]|nr:ThuA domain-containing protein [Solirubrobacter sp.]